MNPITSVQLDVSTLTVLAAFFVAILMVDSYDIALPRGDSIGMSGPLLGAVVVAFGMVPALVMGIASSAIIQNARRLRGRDSALLDELGVRVVSILLAGLSDLALHMLGLSSAAIVVVPGVYLLTELVGRQVALSHHRDRSLLRLLLGNLSRQSLLFAAQLSASALTILTYQSMGVWSLIPVLALLLLMRQAYSMLLDIRETYSTTVSVLIEAAESQTPGQSGHSERTAAIARAIGEQAGLSTTQIERVSYAALLHDIGRISESGESPWVQGDSSSLLADVDFFANVIPVLRIVDGIAAGEGGLDEDNLIAGFIVALASDIDDDDVAAGASGVASISRVSPLVSARLKAHVVAAAVGLGYSVPAIS